MTTILKAHNQWKNRPADERYFDLPEMLEAARVVKKQAIEKPAVVAELRVEAGEDNLLLVGRSGHQAVISNHVFGQLSSRVGAPAAYLRELPQTLAAQNLNHGLKSIAEKDEGREAKLLFNVNGNIVLRALTGPKYARVWDADLLEMVMNSLPSSWKTPRAWPAGVDGERTRAAGPDDVMPGSIIKLGDTIAPAGAYLSDKNMFMFLIDTDAIINDGTNEPMFRGLILSNSEVGDKSLTMSVFNFKQACGNHRILGASEIYEFSHRHVGNIHDAMAKSFEVKFKALSNASVSDEQAQIQAERKLILGTTKEEVVGAVLAFAKKKKIERINAKLLDAAYDAAVVHEDWYSSPHSLYGITNGITEVAQRVATHVDERHAIDVAAGKLSEMAYF
jgi:hypothetical protein